MHRFRALSCILLIALAFAFTDALSIPQGSRQNLVFRNVDDIVGWNEGTKIERLVKSKPKPKPKPAPAPASTPIPKSNPKPSSDTLTPTPTSSKSAVPPGPASPSATTGSHSNTGCRTSGRITVWPSSSASSIRLELPNPTKAYDACDLPDLDCFTTFDGFSEVPDPEPWETYEKGKSIARSTRDQSEPGLRSSHPQRLLEKRGDRDYTVILGTAGSLAIESLGYPCRSKIFTDSVAKKLNIKAHAYQFKPNQDMGNYIIEDLKLTPGSPAIEDFVVEHIIELQTVKMFLEDTVKNSNIDGGFFQQWWNMNIDFNTLYSRPATPQAPIAMWKASTAKAPKVALPDKWRTLNNLVFNALGSAKNRKDFVLCDYEINSAKEKLWHGKSPIEEDKFKEIADDVAKGALTSDVLFSSIRLVFGVFKYFEDATISKMRSVIMHVGAELTSANIAHLTAKQVPNMNLQPLWQNFMEKKLKEVETGGTKWVDKMISHTEEAYKTELQALLLQEKTLAGAPAAQIQGNAALRAKIATQAQNLRVRWHSADKARDDASAVVKKLANNPKAVKKQRDKAEREYKSAKDVAHSALRAHSLKLREGNLLDLTELRTIVANAKKAQTILANMKTYNKNFKMPSAK